jgi:predicted SAM-dependent methyltransferase
MALSIKEQIKKIPLLYLFAKSMRFHYRAFRGSLRLKKMVKTAASLRLVVGAEGIFDKGWIPTDIEYLNFLNQQHWERYFKKDSIDVILAEHVWEHLTTENGLMAAQQCFQYLRPGGYLRAAVPDGYHPDPKYIEWVKPGGIGSFSYDHKVLYNYETFRDVFKKAGFKVNLLEYFDQKGKFHFIEWDPLEGKIHRSSRFDDRNKDGNLKFTSIILDAYKSN